MLSWPFFIVNHAPPFDGVVTGIVLDVAVKREIPFLIYACQIGNKMERVGGNWLNRDLLTLSSTDNETLKVGKTCEEALEHYGKTNLDLDLGRIFFFFRFIFLILIGLIEFKTYN